MFKKVLFLLSLFISCDLFASEDCSRFKFNPDVNVNYINDNNISIKKSDENLIGKLGYVESGIKYGVKYMIVPIMVKGGFCISLRSVDVDIKIPENNIVIDKRLKDNTCAYNIVLQHEKDHIKNKHDIIQSNLENIKTSVLNASSSINPIFIEKESDIEENKEKIYNQLKNHKDVINIIDKIKQELQNGDENIDFRGDIYNVWQCKDFLEEMKNSDNITID